MNSLRELDPQRTPARRAGALPRAEALPALVTREVPGNPAGAVRIREADSARQVYELWHTAGVLPGSCRGPAGVLPRRRGAVRAVDADRVERTGNGGRGCTAWVN
jgi:hypothetical protein